MSLLKGIIGIDLGTTNCTLAYSEFQNEKAEIVRFPIPQIIASGTQSENFMLPSFIYFPLEKELETKNAAIDWDLERSFCVGTFAQKRGGELPSRLICSAKSWLCHSGINRREKILPIQSDEDLQKMSPLEACGQLLRHMREAWEQKLPNRAFHEQQILVTVPASFDPGARQLVLEAAKLAGYPEIILLEEPQAAFYAWLHDHADSWRKTLNVGDRILIVDIGGGTSDFSLIAVEEEQGNLSLRRVAVGAHLLLGGDNIDFSLAYLAKGKLEEEGRTLDDWQFQALIQSCRLAKEALLSDEKKKSADVAIMGRGSKLIGGSLKTALTREDINSLVLEGFLPLVGPEEHSPVERRAGIQQVGLPYAQDARISCQLAKFLSMTGENDKPSMESFVMPTAVLFNGGTLKAPLLRARLVDLLNRWAQQLKKNPVTVLEGADYDFAVSRGAVSYGLARSGKAIRIRSGTNRSYYIGVEEAVPAVPGIPTPIRAICVAPLGMEEGTEEVLDQQEFALVLGESALFRFFSHGTERLASGETPIVGTIVRNWKKELTELHSIETRLDKSKEDGKTVKVKLKSKVTELGVLELWFFSEDGRSWKLEFDTRK